MIEFELFGIRFDLLNTIILMIIGFLLCSFTVCSCMNVEVLHKLEQKSKGAMLYI